MVVRDLKVATRDVIAVRRLIFIVLFSEKGQKNVSR